MADRAKVRKTQNQEGENKMAPGLHAPQTRKKVNPVRRIYLE
jgi:hypothetical protein